MKINHKAINKVAIAALATGVCFSATAQYVEINSSGPAATANGSDSIAIGSSSIVTPSADSGSISIGANSKIGSGDAIPSSGNIALGQGAIVGSNLSTDAASLTNAIAIGTNAQSQRSEGISIGAESNASFAGISIGSSANTEADGAISIGNGSTVHGGNVYKDGISIGTNAVANGTSVSIGSNSSAAQNSATSIGANSKANAYNSTAIGTNSTTSGSNSVAVGADSTDGGATNVFSVGSTSTTRKIINVGEGTISITSSDAIVGSQLYVTNQAAAAAQSTADTALTTANTGVAAAAAAQSTADTALTTANTGVAAAAAAQSTANTGVAAAAAAQSTADTGVAAAAAAQSTADTGVAAAAAAQSTADTALTTADTALTTANKGLAAAANAQATADAAYKLGANSAQYSEDGYELQLRENGGVGTRITNVADGIAETDAVNVRQLKSATARATQEAVEISNKYTDQATAAAAAMPSAPAQLPIGATWIGVGTGAYGTAAAVGLAVVRQITPALTISGAISKSNGGKVMTRVQTGFIF